MIACNEIQLNVDYLTAKFTACSVLTAADMQLLVELIEAVNTCADPDAPNTDDNKFKNIEFGYAANDGGGLSVSDSINSIATPITILADEIPMFTGITIPLDRDATAYFSTYVALAKGKGNYGVGGTITLAETDLVRIEHEKINLERIPDPATNDPNANVEDLGEITGGDFIPVINAANPNYVISAGTNWYFEFTDGGSRKLYGFDGTNGIYGLAALQMVAGDLFLIYDESKLGTSSIAKTSDIPLNDGADGTSTYVETDELPTLLSDLTDDIGATDPIVPFTVAVNTLTGSDSGPTIGLLEDIARPFLTWEAAIAALPADDGTLWTILFTDVGAITRTIGPTLPNRNLEIKCLSGGTFDFSPITGSRILGNTLKINMPFSTFLYNSVTPSFIRSAIMELDASNIDITSVAVSSQGFLQSSDPSSYIKTSNMTLANAVGTFDQKLAISKLIVANKLTVVGGIISISGQYTSVQDWDINEVVIDADTGLFADNTDDVTLKLRKVSGTGTFFLIRVALDADIDLDGLVIDPGVNVHIVNNMNLSASGKTINVRGTCDLSQTLYFKGRGGGLQDFTTVINLNNLTARVDDMGIAGYASVRMNSCTLFTANELIDLNATDHDTLDVEFRGHTMIYQDNPGALVVGAAVATNIDVYGGIEYRDDSTVGTNVTFTYKTQAPNLFTLDADDIDDTSTLHKFTDAAGIAKISNLPANTLTEIANINSTKSDKAEVILTDGTTVFTPTVNNHPANKLYVDTEIAALIAGGFTIKTIITGNAPEYTTVATDFDDEVILHCTSNSDINIKIDSQANLGLVSNGTLVVLRDSAATGKITFTYVAPATGPALELILPGDGMSLLRNGADTWEAWRLPNQINITGTPDGTKFLRDDGIWTDIPGGGDALTASPLNQFAATTSAQLKTVMSDETGSGALVFANSPALVTPTGIVKGDVGLGNVDNTSDVTKDAATATLTNKTINTASNTVIVNAADVSDFDTEVTNNVTVAANLAKLTPTALTGVGLVLDSPVGKYYNMAAANAGLTYTFSGAVIGGWAISLINTATEPVVTGATKIAGATWVVSTAMYLVVRHNGTVTQYFFLEI